MRVLSGILAGVFLLIAIAISPLSMLRTVDATGNNHYLYISPEALGGLSHNPEELRAWIPTAGCLIAAVLLAYRAFRRS